MPELIEWPCDFPRCDLLVLQDWAICEYCFEVRCSEHDTDEHHECNSLDSREARKQKKQDSKRSYLAGLLERLQEHATVIIDQASKLHHGLSCNLIIPENTDQLLESGLLAGFNVHFKLNFQDGTKWLLRIRQDQGHRIPLEIRHSNIASEVATLNTLNAGGLPVPAAFLPPSLEQELPFDYFFYEFLEGETWHIPKHPFYSVTLPDEKLVQLVEGYAQIQVKLSQMTIPVNKIGCLRHNSSQELSVGPIIARGCFQKPQSPYLLGPFDTMKDRYLAHIDAALRYIALGAICSWDPVDAYLWHLELRELVSSNGMMAQPLKEVFIKHDDEKGDHIMWNEKGEVVGVLDWEWAYVTSKGEAFSSPYIFYDMQDYIRGSNELTKEEHMLMGCYERQNRPDLVDCVKNGRLYQRLTRIGQYDSAYGKEGFREPFRPIPISDFDPPSSDTDWRVYMMKRYNGEEALQKVMAKYGWSVERAEKEAQEYNKEKK
ncbi:uncharacterized protein I303_103163 [Kwoniella dejecticola CBS 10117]|uniref:Aminoglycoside phosphotransferase domain-containing protein n=1 Tax=Kwoniella dejecticola CBS 10117 TaxID=1296121 RepID=A0A1A6AAT4_9TREE|nr:uncharacterized protein I303_03184 [Kwoniella dejecticola CBS 10117]OBR87160.1 hypothetical protein I303_03184 [Kwoniella dejecticola CBS 10117]